MKLRVARDRVRRDKGRCEGRRGYSIAAPQLVEEVRKLRRRPKGRAKRRTYGEIATILNERGEKTLTGKRFTNKVIYQIVNYGKKPGKRG